MESSGNTMAAVGLLGCLEREMKRPERPTNRRSAASSKSRWWQRKSMPMMGNATSACRKVQLKELLLLVTPAAEEGATGTNEAGT